MAMSEKMGDDRLSRLEGQLKGRLEVLEAAHRLSSHHHVGSPHRPSRPPPLPSSLGT